MLVSQPDTHFPGSTEGAHPSELQHILLSALRILQEILACEMGLWQHAGRISSQVLAGSVEPQVQKNPRCFALGI